MFRLNAGSFSDRINFIGGKYFTFIKLTFIMNYLVCLYMNVCAKSINQSQHIYAYNYRAISQADQKRMHGLVQQRIGHIVL